MNFQALICEYNQCKLILENPIVLPCGYSLCQKHLEQFEQNFKCCFCTKQHQIPEDGFSISKTIDSMINSYFELNPLKKEIIESFLRLSESIKEYEDINPNVYIYDYFAQIRNVVDLHREELIK